MADPWSAEFVVGVELARGLVELQFPDLAGRTVEPLGVGWDNTAYVVGGEWVFRFPRRRFALPLNERETRLLPAVAPRVPLPVPVPTRFGRADDRFPWPFAGYRFLHGRTACEANLDDAPRAAAAATLGRFLAALHAFAADEAAALGARPDDIRKLDVGYRAPPAWATLIELRDAAVVSSEDLPGLEQALNVAPRIEFKSVFAHGDLYARHVLVDDACRPAGIIDWGDCHLGDPAVDLSLAHHLLPPSAHETFRRAYGPIDDAAWRLARFRAVVHAAACVKYARSVGDADLLREGGRTLKWTAASAVSADA